MKQNNILFIFEGEVTEPRILDNLKKVFFSEKSNKVFYAVYGAEIFQLAQKVKEDPFLDIIVLLKEDRSFISHNATLEQFRTEQDFSAIYLFFDHDGHSHTTSGELSQVEYTRRLHEILDYFNDETEHGKLMLSYPMVEAVQDTILRPSECDHCYVYLSDNKEYKALVHTNCEKVSISSWNKTDWLTIITENLLRCFLLQGCKDIPSLTYKLALSNFSQDDILNEQYAFYLTHACSVVVLSAFPLFLVEYFGDTLFREIDLSSINNKYCSYCCLLKKDL